MKTHIVLVVMVCGLFQQMISAQTEEDTAALDNIYISQGLNTQYRLLPPGKQTPKYKYISLVDMQDDQYSMGYFNQFGDQVYTSMISERKYQRLVNQLTDIEKEDSEALRKNYYSYNKVGLSVLTMGQGFMTGFLSHGFNYSTVAFPGSPDQDRLLLRTALYAMIYTGAQGFTTLALTSGTYVRPAMLIGQSSGWVTGYIQSIQIHRAFFPSSRNPISFTEPEFPPSRLHFAAIFAYLEGWTNYIIAKKRNYSVQESKLYVAGGIFGNVVGWHAGRIIDARPQSILPPLLGISGYFAGAILGPKSLGWSDRTNGDINTIIYSSVLGTVSGYAFSNFSGKTRLRSSYVLLGGLTGLASGILATRHTRLNDFVEINLGIGLMAGTAAGLLVSLPTVFSEEPVILSDLLVPALVVGFCAGHIFNVVSARKKRESKEIGYHYNINPLGLVGMFSRDQPSMEMALLAPPIFQAQMKF